MQLWFSGFRVKELEFGANSRISVKNELGLGSRTRTRMFMLTFLKPEHRNETASDVRMREES
jgi:hypothetical protein